MGTIHTIRLHDIWKTIRCQNFCAALQPRCLARGHASHKQNIIFDPPQTPRLPTAPPSGHFPGAGPIPGPNPGDLVQDLVPIQDLVQNQESHTLLIKFGDSSDHKCFHMVRYEVMLRQDGAIAPKICSKPRTPTEPIKESPKQKSVRDLCQVACFLFFLPCFFAWG